MFKICTMNILRIIIIPIIIFSALNLLGQEQKEVAVSPFSKVKFEGSAKFVLVPSGSQKVVIESKKPDVFDYIDIHNEGSTLVINTTGKNKNVTKLFKSVTVYVHFTTLNDIAMSGAGSVKCEKPFSAGNLTATMRGTGSMDLDVKCSVFTGNMYGTGSLDVRGTAGKAVIDVDGVGGFSGYDLIAKDVDVVVSGVGGAKVHATHKLKAKLNGVGSIRYKGDPEIKDFDTNGLGNIRKAKDTDK